MNNSNGNSNTSGIISDNVVSNGGSNSGCGRNTNATAATIEFSDIFNDEIERGNGFVSGTTAASNSNTTIIANNNINNNSTIVHNMLNSSTANDNNSALSNNVNQLHQWVDPVLAASPYNFFLADPPSTTTTTTSADNNNTTGAVLRQQQQTIICQPQMQQIQQIQQQQQPQFHQQFPTWQDMTNVNNNNNMNVGNANTTAMLPQHQPQSQPQSTPAGMPPMIQAQQAHQQLSQNNNKNSNSMGPLSIKIKQEPKKTSTLPSATSSTMNNMNKRKNPSEISEDDLSIKQRRKYERNIREQQRSHRITAQIIELRRVLSETAQVHFQKTDKHSILHKAVEYIRHLQVCRYV